MLVRPGTSLAPTPEATTSSSAPRVVIAHDYLTQRGGAERVVLAMLEAFPTARLVTTFYDPEATFPQFRDHDVQPMWTNKIVPLRDDPRRAFPLLSSAVSRHRIDDADVVLVSSSGWAHGFPTDAKKVVYCHNPARWLYQREDYAAGIPSYARLALRALTPRLKRWDRAAAGTVDQYFANSSAVKGRIKDAYGIDATLLFPPPGLEPTGAQEPVDGLEPGFLLSVGRPRGYKNMSAICEAVAAEPEVRLVVVGGVPEDFKECPDRVVGVSGISDAQLRWLYANAAGLVAVSHEDFGLTPVEGYGFGLPSVLLRAGGYLDSSVEGLTTVFVDRVGADEVRRGIRTLLGRDWDREAIKAHAETFSRATFKRRLVDAVNAAAGVRTAVTTRAVPDFTFPQQRTRPRVLSEPLRR